MLISVAEAAIMADILDKQGDYSTASLLDEYIEADGDIKKQAGLWDRVKGRLKRTFVEEYKELWKRAKEAQEALGKQLEDDQERFDELSKLLKNYRLNEWRYGVHRMNIDTKNIMDEFDKSYGRYLQFVVGVREQTPSAGGETDVSKSESERLEEIMKKPESIEGIYASKLPDGRIRMRRDYFTKALKHHLQQNENKVQLVEHIGSKPDKRLQELFGNKTWNIDVLDQKGNYVLLSPIETVETGQEKVEPPSMREFPAPTIPEIKRKEPEKQESERKYFWVRTKSGRKARVREDKIQPGWHEVLEPAPPPPKRRIARIQELFIK